MNKVRESLFNLMRENPDLPVVPLVDTELVADGFRAYWLGSLDDCEIGFYYSDEDAERVYIFNLDKDELIDRYVDLHEDDLADLTDEEIEERANEWIKTLPWIKAVLVWISS